MTTTQARQLLRRRLEAACVAADEHIAAYEARSAHLRRNAAGSASQYEIAKRDDKPIQDLANRVAFQTAQVNRLALTLLVDMMSELVERNRVEDRNRG